MLGLDPSVDAPKKSYFFLEVLMMNEETDNLDLIESPPFRNFDICHQEAITKANKIAELHGEASVTETDGSDPRLPRYCVVSDDAVVIAQIDMVHVDYSKETIH